MIGSRQHRQPERRGLQQIVAADRHQTAADERHVGRCIQRREFAHAIHQQDLRGRIRRDAAAAPGEAHAAAAEQIRNGPKPLRMPRHQQQQRIRSPGSQLLVRREHLLLLARVRAAGDPRRSCAAERRAQRSPLIDDRGTQFHVELDIAEHVRPGTLRADGNEALRILRGLSRYQRTGRENSAKQAAEAPVSRDRLRRQPRAREHQRHGAAFALLEQIGPQLGFHDDGETRPNAVQEARDRTRCVIGEEAHVDAVAEQALRARPAGRRGRGQHQRDVRIPRAQSAHQRRRRRHLSQADGMQPDRGRVLGAPAPPEALAQSLPITAITQSAPQHPRKREWHRAVNQQ